MWMCSWRVLQCHSPGAISCTYPAYPARPPSSDSCGGM